MTPWNGNIFRVTGPQMPVTRSFDAFFVLRLNKRLRKQSWGRSFETLSRTLCRHCNTLLNYAIWYISLKLWQSVIISLGSSRDCFDIGNTLNLQFHEISVSDLTNRSKYQSSCMYCYRPAWLTWTGRLHTQHIVLLFPDIPNYFVKTCLTLYMSIDCPWWKARDKPVSKPI